jgi:hypothetical protein
MAHDMLVTIENGLVFGKSQVRAKVALQMILTGAAVPATPSSIKLTFEGYNLAPAPKKPGREPRPSGPTPAMPSVQDELVYAGSRAEGSPVTGSVLVLRKVRKGQFQNWGEKDRFPSRRFNPDRITPMFPSLRAYQAAQAGA